MNKIPNNPERQLIDDILDIYAMRKSDLKDTDWYKHYKKNSKASVISLYKLRCSVFFSDLSMGTEKIILKLLSILPPDKAIRIFYFLVRMKEKSGTWKNIKKK